MFVRAGNPLRIGVRLAVDPGTVRIGVARSDPGGVLATPLTVVRRGKGDLDALAALATEEAMGDIGGPSPGPCPAARGRPLSPPGSSRRTWRPGWRRFPYGCRRALHHVDRARGTAGERARLAGPAADRRLRGRRGAARGGARDRAPHRRRAGPARRPRACPVSGGYGPGGYPGQGYDTPDYDDRGRPRPPGRGQQSRGPAAVPWSAAQRSAAAPRSAAPWPAAPWSAAPWSAAQRPAAGRLGPAGDRGPGGYDGQPGYAGQAGPRRPRLRAPRLRPAGRARIPAARPGSGGYQYPDPGQYQGTGPQPGQYGALRAPRARRLRPAR